MGMQEKEMEVNKSKTQISQRFLKMKIRKSRAQIRVKSKIIHKLGQNINRIRK